MAATVLQMELIKGILRWGWDVDAYSMNSKAKDQAEISQVDAAITSDLFWGCLCVLNMLSVGVSRSVAWCNSCRCHWDLESDSREVMRLWQSCPMRGRRLPEIAAGDFVDAVRDLFAVCHGKLLALLAALSLGEDATSKLIHAFELARSRFIFLMIMKTCPLQEPPGCLFQISHFDQDKVVQALEKCLVSESMHPKIRALQSFPHEEQAVSYLAGEELQTLPELELLIGRKLFTLCVEYSLEGEHAKIERKVGNIVNRTEAYNSLVLRLPFFAKLFKRFPHVREIVSSCIEGIRNPLDLLLQLGFQNHPAVIDARQQKTHRWSRIWRQILYHADLYSLYEQVVPDIRMVDPRAGLVALKRIPLREQSVTDTLWKLAAVRHILALMKGEMDIFSCVPPQGCLESLQRLLLEDGTLDDLPGLDWLHSDVIASSAEQSYGDWADWKRGKSMFLTVVVHNVRGAKKMQQGSVIASDVGINIHGVWKVLEPTVAVGGTPLNIDLSGTAHHGKDLVAVVLSLSMFTLEDLYSFRVWEHQKKVHKFELSGLDDVPPSATTMEEHMEVADHIAQHGVLPLPTSSGSARFIEWLVAQKLAESKQGKLVLTNAGCVRIRSGWLLDSAKRCLRARDIARDDMTKFELMTLLEHDGWCCQHYSSFRAVKDVAVPYVGGGRKIWFFKLKKDIVDLGEVTGSYLRCLLAWSVHQQPVPHFGTVNDYELITNPLFQPKSSTRRRRFVDVVVPALLCLQTYRRNNSAGKLKIA